MQFSSLIFLYLFLPLTLLFYYLSPKTFRNYFLLLASLIFFSWGGVSFTIILIVSILVNYFFGRRIERTNNSKLAYHILTAGVVFNLMLLCVFKYANFIVENVNSILKFILIPTISNPEIVLPIGISFYTFHALSYLIDIYRGKTKAQKNIFDLALYITMFSQLIAGPIVRYSDVWQQLRNRAHSIIGFAYGVKRFLIGLSKKILLANTFAGVADAAFNSNVSELSSSHAWLGIICYTLQIYFDFSGYSDMAIGLGHMFGFDFKENFNLPYGAKSVKDFWRKWHISLSTFFRDYVYIPLGGNQMGKKRTYLNLVLVFFLTGFWHGANWTFIFWGLYHGLLLIIERLGFEKTLKTIWSPLAHIYTLFVVIIGWILFRSLTIEQALEYTKALFMNTNETEQNNTLLTLLNPELILCLIIGILSAIGFTKFILENVNAIFEKPRLSFLIKPVQLGSLIFYFSLLFLCTIYLISGSYNPFIYYKF